MGLIDRWKGQARREDAPPPASVAAQTQREETRRELLTMAVRDTLRKNGLPAHWFATEVSVVTAARERALQLRLVLREWQPQLLAYTVALQRAIESKLHALDPLSSSWLGGITWKFEPADPTQCPHLPAASYWAGQGAVEAAESPGPLERLRRKAESVLAGATTADFMPTEPLLPGA